MDIEKLLTREQKEGILRSRLNICGTHGDFTISYDRRFGWDFEVRRSGSRVSVIFSVSILSPRFSYAVMECARAIRDMRGSTHAKGLRNAVAISGAMRMKGRGLWLKGAIRPATEVMHRSSTALVLREGRV